jgi:hypothetical protein
MFAGKKLFIRTGDGTSIQKIIESRTLSNMDLKIILCISGSEQAIKKISNMNKLENRESLFAGREAFLRGLEAQNNHRLNGTEYL